MFRKLHLLYIRLFHKSLRIHLKLIKHPEKIQKWREVIYENEAHVFIYNLYLGPFYFQTVKKFFSKKVMECQIEKYPHLRHVLLYEYNHGVNTRQASININAIYDDGIGFMSERSAQTWFNKFRNLNFDLGDAPRSGRPVETDEDQLKALLEDDARQTVRELAEQLGRHCHRFSPPGKARICPKVGCVVTP